MKKIHIETPVPARIYAVLMAGGKGSRLWPLSTENYSKPFIPLWKKRPLVTETIKRLQGLIAKKNIMVVVTKAQEELLKMVVKRIPKKNIIVEPFGRNTASAVGLAAIELDPHDIMVVLPTDILIKETNGFRKAIKEAVDFVSGREGILLCIGVRPKYPAISYGYIKIKSLRSGRIYSIDRFIEKPKKIIAARLIKERCYLWNAGMFVFKTKDILDAMEKHAPLLYRELMRIKKDKKKKALSYSRMKNVSIDYQIMEKAKNLYCLKGNFSWHDLGNWTGLGGLFKKDQHGNVCIGKATLIDTYNSIVYNSVKEKLGVVGLKSMIVANTEEGLLVCSKRDADKVKELVRGQVFK